MLLEIHKSTKARRIRLAWSDQERGNLSLSEKRDGKRVLYGEMEQVGLKFGGGWQEAYMRN